MLILEGSLAFRISLRVECIQEIDLSLMNHTYSCYVTSARSLSGLGRKVKGEGYWMSVICRRVRAESSGWCLQSTH